MNCQKQLNKLKKDEHDAKAIGVEFAKKYYEGAIRGPDGVMQLFGDNSVYVDANGKEAHGLEDIRTAIGNLNLQEKRIRVVSISAAFTDNGGIMVQAIANYITESDTYGFSESFHLVSQSKGWYVRSSLFKWHETSPEDAKTKATLLPSVVADQPNQELANGHTEAKKPTPEMDAKVAEEAKKPSKERKVSQPKDRNLTNGTSTPPTTPTNKKTATPQKDPKSPLSAPPAAQTPPAAPKPASTAAPTSWAACVGGGAKSTPVATKPAPVVANNGNVKSLPTTTAPTNAASDATVKSPTVNGSSSTNVEGVQDKQQRHKKFGRAKSDFTVHVSKIVKGKKATEKDVVVDITKAFQEFGPIAHVRVPGRRLADDDESTLYAFVDFQEKEDFDKMFADRDKDNSGRVKLTLNLPVLQFNGEVIIAPNHDRAGRYRNNRPPQIGNRHHSNKQRKENGTIKAKN
uniref:NTF2 domain-containing protein n=1 Tax=Panagrolaimus sp. PS1159 TaxID=55785 RepID=A0AC35GPE2_9BILA